MGRQSRRKAASREAGGTRPRPVLALEEIAARAAGEKLPGAPEPKPRHMPQPGPLRAVRPRPVLTSGNMAERIRLAALGAGYWPPRSVALLCVEDRQALERMMAPAGRHLSAADAARLEERETRAIAERAAAVLRRLRDDEYAVWEAIFDARTRHDWAALTAGYAQVRALAAQARAEGRRTDVDHAALLYYMRSAGDGA